MTIQYDDFEYEIDSEKLSEFWDKYTKEELIQILIEHNIDDHFQDEIKELFEEEANDSHKEAELEEQEFDYLRRKI